MATRDGHVRVLPLHVANKIAAGEVVERPASVAKELLENALDAGARTIAVQISQGGRKLVAVRDDGCGMTRDDAVLALERQATSKILDVDDIESIDTLGFRGEAIPSIASVSRLTLTTRRADSDEGTRLTVNAGVLAEVAAAGCPPGTLVEVRDLFCNVPARRKFLRAYATEEAHVRHVFAIHALAHPAVGFSLTADGRELYRLAPSAALADRVRDLFGPDFLDALLPVASPADAPIRVTGFIERPNPSTPTRRDQCVFVNGRPATAPAIAYALREACPKAAGDVRPAAVLFIDLPPDQVDVNVHPTKREVRFRDNAAVKQAILDALADALRLRPAARPAESVPTDLPAHTESAPIAPTISAKSAPTVFSPVAGSVPTNFSSHTGSVPTPKYTADAWVPPVPTAQPIQVEFAIDPETTRTRPWEWFSYLATMSTGDILLETDAGLIMLNPRAARERLAFERLRDAESGTDAAASQALLMPETVHLPPADAARVLTALPTLIRLGFALEPFGTDTFKVDAVPQLLNGAPMADILPTIARDLAEASGRTGGTRWREEQVAKAVARAFAGQAVRLDAAEATRLVEELADCRIPYVSPRGKPVLVFTSRREIDRKFARTS